MAGPGALLLLGGLLGGVPRVWGGPGGALGTPGSAETPPELEEEVAIVRRSDPEPPHCFSRTLHELSCAWDSPGPPEPERFRLQFRLETDPWQECPLRAAALASPVGWSRFLCSLPPSATVTFVPLELRVLPGTPPGTLPGTTGTTGTPPGTLPGTTGTTGTPPGTTGTPPVSPLFHRTLFIDQVVLPGPPRNVSVSAGGARGELCVRWVPPPGPYLHSSLVFELALSPPGGPPKTVGVPAGRREQGVGGLRGSTPYSVRARARPDGVSYGGFWGPWSPPATASTPPDLDAVTLGLSCLLVLLLVGLGALGLLGHRRTLRAKLWPPVPGPEREFEGLFSACGGNFQLWLYQDSGGAPWAPPPEDAEELPSSVEELGEPPLPPPLPETPPPQPPPPPPPPPGDPSPSPSFEYTLFDPGSALLCPPPPPRDPPRDPSPTPYANLGPSPTKGVEPKWGGGGEPPALGHAPHYVICS